MEEHELQSPTHHQPPGQLPSHLAWHTLPPISPTILIQITIPFPIPIAVYYLKTHLSPSVFNHHLELPNSPTHFHDSYLDLATCDAGHCIVPSIIFPDFILFYLPCHSSFLDPCCWFTVNWIAEFWSMLEGSRIFPHDISHKAWRNVMKCHNQSQCVTDVTGTLLSHQGTF